MSAGTWPSGNFQDDWHLDLAIAEAIIDAFGGDLTNQAGAEVQGDTVAAAMRPVGGVGMPHLAADEGASSSSRPAKAASAILRSRRDVEDHASASAQVTQAQEDHSAFGSPPTGAHAGNNFGTPSKVAHASQASGGRGPPIKVAYKCGTRSIHDGGGLCSPGRWPPDRRLLPGASNDAIRSAFTQGLRC